MNGKCTCRGGTMNRKRPVPHYERETPCRGCTIKMPMTMYGRGNAHCRGYEQDYVCMDGEMPMPRRHYVWTGKCPCRARHYVWTGKRAVAAALCMGKRPRGNAQSRWHYERDVAVAGKRPVAVAL